MAKQSDQPSKFGSRPGSQAARIDNALTSQPQTAQTLADALGLGVTRVRSHLRHLVAEGYATHEQGKYAAKPQKPKKSSIPAKKAGATARPKPKPK